MILARARGPLGWTLGDQALSSATNFLLVITVARAADPAALGAFTLALSTYYLAAGISQAVVSEPLLVRHAASRAALDLAIPAALGLAVVLGCGASLVVITGGGLVSNPDLSEVLIVLGVFLPFLILQDTLRYAFFARQEPRGAFISDLAWGILQLSTVAAVAVKRPDEVGALVLAWAASGAVACALALILMRVMPRPLQAWTWFRHNADLTGPYTLEFAVGHGTVHSVAFGVGLIAGLPAAGALRLAHTLFGPLHVLFTSLRVTLLPRMVVSLQEGPQDLLRSARRLSCLFSVAAGGYGLILVFLPEQVGRAAIGANWELATPLLAFVALERFISAMASGATTGIKAMQLARKSALIRVGAGVLLVSAALLGAELDGARGAAAGQAFTAPVVAAAWWLFFRRALANDEVPVRSSARTDGG